MKKRLRFPLLLGLLMVVAITCALLATATAAEPSDTADTGTVTAEITETAETVGQGDKYTVMPDTWVFTDSLGRTSLTNEDVGDPKSDKTLAMFYWTWHCEELAAELNNPLNVNDFMLEHPEAKNDYDHPAWPTSRTAYFWNEPIFGYYQDTDAWVARRQAEMLANAGVDAIFTDNTNGTYTWKESYDVVFSTWEKAAADGVQVPKVSFMLPFGANENTNTQLHKLYDDVYKDGRFESLWFRWEGKPLLMAWGTALSTIDPEEKEIFDFFTFRRNYPTYRYDAAPNQMETWGWLSAYPQAYYYGTRSNKKEGIVEQVTVGTAQNHNYMTDTSTAMNGTYVMGRSFTSAVARGEIPYPTDPDAKKYGYNFSEQFEYALELDPQVIFVTGWNEWTMGRHQEWMGVENAFPDQYNDEYSRDIEPTRGDLGDCYYYQLVNYVRQYKGVRPIPTPTEATTIDITAGTAQWESVGPFYAAYQGNTGDRDAAGFGSMSYTDYSGRNDIIGSQIARDDETIYFLVECAEDITPYTDPLWMVLYIDSDQENQGWETFDYVINKTSPTADEAVLERFVDGYTSEMVGHVRYTVDGRYLQIAVPKTLLGIEGDDFTINFSVTDNVHDWEGSVDPAEKDEDRVYTTFSGDILDFYTSGDVAPGMRFKYSYISTSANAHPKVETESQPETTAEPETETETETEGEETTDDVTPVDTTRGADTTVAETTTTTDPSGCKSVLGLTPVALSLAMGVAWVACRKKETE